MSQEVARREAGTSVVRATPVPTALAELGVRIGQDESSGHAVVMIPPQVRQHVNVINPVSSFVQADPNWTPSISLVQLDKESHSYNVSGKMGLNKQALETLAVAGGVIETRVRRLKQDELGPGEMWGYEATVVIRRSDGVAVPTTRSRTFNGEAERAQIEDDVRAAKWDGRLKFDTEEKVAAECRKRWLAELRFGPSKTESKAINRAIRAALQVPTSLKPADFAKPFLVIGYSFTPNYDDIEVKRMLVAAGLGATGALYGQPLELGPSTDIEHSAPEASSDTPVEDDGGADGAEGTVADDAGESTPQAGEDGEGTSSQGAPSSPVPGDDPEPEPEPAPAAEQQDFGFAPPDDVVDAIAQTEVTIGQWQGRTLEQIASEGEAGERWLLWACRHSDERLPGDLRANVHAFVKARVPSVWEQYAGGSQS